MKELAESNRSRLIAVGDISCDKMVNRKYIERFLDIGFNRVPLNF
jgi:hypothetical protein